MSTPRLRPRFDRFVLGLVTVAVASPALGGCLRGDALKVAMLATVVAVKTAQLVAASSRAEARGRYANAGGGSSATRAPGTCGVCQAPENGYALCFVSSCEVRCIEGYVLVGDECRVEESPSAPPYESETPVR